MDNSIQKFREAFVEEAKDLLDKYETDLLYLERNQDDGKRIESAFRNMHTLKGASAMFGFNYMNEITHKLESVFQRIREKQMLFDKEIFDITFSAIDHLRKLIFDETLSDENLKKEHQMLSDLIGALTESPSSGSILPESPGKDDARDYKLWHILLHATEFQYNRGVNFLNIFRELSALGLFTVDKIQSDLITEPDLWSITLNTKASAQEIGEIFLFIEDDCKITCISSNIEDIDNDKNRIKEPSILEAINLPPFPKNREKDSDSPTHIAAPVELRRISVDPDKLDHQMFLVSEFITLNSKLALAVKNKNSDAINSHIEKLDSLSKQFRDVVLELRLVPISEIVLRFQRLIRDVSKQCGKKIDFQTSGTENGIDKSLIDKLAEPLMHIIRNCIDHGIEVPAKRLEQGKHETGVIRLSAYHSGGRLYIKTEDDGNGIDITKVRTKAVKMGLIMENDTISKKELVDFIFIPGFSTAQSLTSISGRGIGMDVVRKKIQDLRGDIRVESQEGIGTSFTMMIPQSVSIIDTLLVSVEDIYFTIPIAEIDICRDIDCEALNIRRHASVIPHNNELIPFIDIRKVLCLKGTYAKQIKLVIIQNNEQKLAVLADRIIGEHQAVTKPLNKLLTNQNLFKSASQLGDGSMAFMMDTGELFESFGKSSVKTESE